MEAVIHSLGLTRNPAKGQWEPSQRVDHLGLTVSTELSEGGGLGVEHITDQYQPQGSGGFERRQDRRRGRAHRSERSEALQEAEELEAQPRKTLRAAMEAVLQPGEKEDATRR